jgi:hypothetical protein
MENSCDKSISCHPKWSQVMGLVKSLKKTLLKKDEKL